MVPMTKAKSEPPPLARAQALDTWAAGRERAIAKLVREAEALEEYELLEEAACLWHIILRLRESARREHAEAAALRAAWEKRRMKQGELEKS
jgi:hypothetical protein